MEIKIYADGSDPEEMVSVIDTVSGFTTNPTLMRKAGIVDYEAFARKVLRLIPNHPISFEVFADEIPEMERQAKRLASYGENVYVKIPITNTKGVSTGALISRLLSQGIKVNVTAVFTIGQIAEVCEHLYYSTPAILSIFAGRIADTGIDPKRTVKQALELVPSNVEVLWASCREVYNIYEAEAVGCHIVTVPNNLIKKLSLFGKSLEEFSVETVKMFYDDAQSSGFTLGNE
jgi:transaldolase